MEETETLQQTVARLKANNQTRENREHFKTSQTVRIQFRQKELQQLIILLDREYKELRQNCENPYKKVVIRRLRRKIGRAFSKIDTKVSEKFNIA